jgi:Stigma-specific protein, Stig1
MHQRRFDTLALVVAGVQPRRRIFGGVLSAISAALALPEIALACKKVGRKCDKNKDCCNGARCIGGKNGKCRCKGGFTTCNKDCFNLDIDEKHCGSCSDACASGETCCNGTCVDLQTDLSNCGSCGHACGETESCVAGVCFTADGCPVGADGCAAPPVPCGMGNCFCSQSTEGETICGVPNFDAVCGECESSADCASLGPGAFCVATGSTFCCGPDAQNVCRLPCPT